MAEIDQVRTSTGVPVTAWRAANKGAENYDWWRVNGEGYLTAYYAWRIERAAAGWSIWRLPNGAPAVEVPFRLDVAGIPVDGFVDSIWYHTIEGHEILDLKFGASLPVDHFQVGTYAHWFVRTHFPSVDYPISAAYYAGRRSAAKGPSEALHGAVDNVLDVVPWETVVWQTWQANELDRARLYLPRRSTFCNACAVRDLCPVGAS